MKIFLRLLQFSKPYRHYLPEYCIYILFYIIFGLLNFALIIPLLDVLFNTNTTTTVQPVPAFSLTPGYFSSLFNHYLNHYLETGSKFSVLLFVCAVLLLFVLLKNFFGFMSQKVLTRMRVGLVRRIRNNLFQQFTAQSLQFFSKEKKGDLMSTLSSDVAEVENTVVTSIQTLFRDPLVIIATFTLLFYYSPQLTFFTMIFFPVSGILISNISRRLRKKSALTQGLVGQILSRADEALSGTRVIKAFGAEAFVNKRFDEENTRLSRNMKSIMNQRELASPLSEFLGVTVIVVIILYGGYLILEGRSAITASQFIAYIAFYYQIINPVKNTANAITYLQRGLASGERILRIIDAPQVITDKPGATTITQFEESVQFCNVAFSFGGENVLQDINLVIPKGKMIALVGESGAGKSTMADLIPRFYDPTAGAILFDGKDLRDLTSASLRAQIAVVSQEAILFNDTVLNNIIFGSENYNEEAAIAAAKAANAHQFISELEDGYHTYIGDRGTRLSGGQRQRLTIARAIYKNAPILILDEATSALDTESERLVQEAINNMMAHRTAVVIAHRLSTIKDADEIIVMQRGRIAEKGTHEDLMSKKGYYYRLVQLQSPIGPQSNNAIADTEVTF